MSLHRVAPAILLTIAVSGWAADQTILGDRLLVQGSPVPAKRAVILRAHERGSGDGIVGNPVTAGARLTIRLEGTTPNRETYALPPGFSARTGRAFWSGDVARGFRYRDKLGENGPVRSAQIRKKPLGTFELRAKIDGRVGTIGLAPPADGSGACALFEITDGDSYSVAFGDGTTRNDGAARFEVLHPSTQASCALPVGPSPDPIGTVEPSSTLIGCGQATQRIAVTSSVHLDPSCVYTRGFDITASNVTLDCRGASVVRDPAFNNRPGIHIEVPTTEALHDVTVRNCNVSGFANNLRVSRAGFKDLLPGTEYDVTFSNIVIENNTFTNSVNTGVFVNAFVTGVRLSRNTMTGSGSVGIYLEAGSKDGIVEQNLVTNNGWKDVIPGPASIDISGTIIYYLATGREGIAIDGSRNYVVRDNVVTHNAAGGIFVYKNCGENSSEPGHWVRLYGSTGNVITGNRVADGPNGIWVASRAAENLLFMDCSDPPYVSSASQRIYVDPDAGNTVSFNRIEAMTNAIRVEADDTVVYGNSIFTADRGVLFGTKYRTEVLAQPITNTTIRANATFGVATPFSWVWGTGVTTFLANVGNGVPGTLVLGTQPTINPFFGVIQVLGP